MSFIPKQQREILEKLKIEEEAKQEEEKKKQQMTFSYGCEEC